VKRRDQIVLSTCDPSMNGFWLVEEYFPEIQEIDRRSMPTVISTRASGCAATGPCCRRAASILDIGSSLASCRLGVLDDRVDAS
jgi:hypothetical protein